MHTELSNRLLEGSGEKAQLHKAGSGNVVSPFLCLIAECKKRLCLCLESKPFRKSACSKVASEKPIPHYPVTLDYK